MNTFPCLLGDPIITMGAPKLPVPGIVLPYGLRSYSSSTSSFRHDLILNQSLISPLTFDGKTIMASKQRRQRQKRVRIHSHLRTYCGLLIEPYQTQHISSLRPSTAPRGLPTPRDWCYISSVLQAFLNAPKSVKWLEQEDQSCTAQSCLACALRVLTLNYWKEPLDSRSMQSAHKDLRRTLRQSLGRSLTPSTWIGL